jgi:hypothetical protein
MYDFPPLDRYDLLAGAAVLVLIVFAYLIYPVHLVQITVWLLIFVVFLAWMAYFGWKWVFDMRPDG